MKQIHTLSTLLIILLLPFVACTEKGTYDPVLSVVTLQPHMLKVSPSSFTFDGNTGGSASLTITAQNTDWDFSPLPDWLSIDSDATTRGETTQTVTLTSSPNISSTARTAVFYVSSSDEKWAYSIPITVTQTKARFTITPSSTSLTFDGGAASQTIVVTTLADNWTVTPMADLSDWCSVTRTDDSHVQISVQPNVLSVSRTGHIELATDTETATVTVTQRPAKFTSVFEEIHFNQAGGSQTIGNAVCDAPWTAQTSYDWLSLTPSTGAAGETPITIHATANNSMETRTGYLYLVLSNENKQEIKVTQEGITFDVSNTSFSYSPEGGEMTFVVNTNAHWIFSYAGTQDGELPDWLSLSPSEGVGTTEVTLTAARNPYDTSRSTTLVLRPSAVNAPVTLSVTQEALTFNVTGDALQFGSDGGSMQMALTSNGEWTAIAKPTSWFSVTPSSGKGSATLTVTAQPNDNKNTRQGELTVSCGELSNVFPIIQTGTWLNISADAFHFTSKGGSETLTLSTDRKWTATKSGNWITLSAYEGEGNITLTVTTADNPSANARSGSFTITTDDGKSVSATVTQDARYLSVQTTSATFTSDGGTFTVSLSTDGTYDVTSPADWLTCSKYTSSFILTATQNATAADREADVTVFLTDLTEGKLEHTIHVTQSAGAITLSVDTDKLNFPNEGSTQTVTLTSNSSWTATAKPTSYFTVTPTSGTGSASLTVTAKANLTYNTRTGALTVTSGSETVTVTLNQEGMPTPAHKYVDLGLPSGLLWATCNVGASSPEEYGDYFAWGETKGKSNYSWTTYKWCNGSYSTLKKYNTSTSYGTVDRKTVLDLSDDAANVNWGGEWRTATNDEWAELRDNCTWTLIVQNYVKGYKVSGKNGNSIFLPAAGDCEGDGTFMTETDGIYWSSSLDEPEPYAALSIWFNSTSVGHSSGGRCSGHSIRPVKAPAAQEHEYVDLGLPSGLLWATCNIGATSPEENGDYFAWGETEPKSDYNWDTYKWCKYNSNGSTNTLTKYNANSSYGTVDNKTVLDLQNDAAHVNWGGSWRMPTDSEIQELLDNCSWMWISQNGHDGCKLISMSNSKSIFLPAAGIYNSMNLLFARSTSSFWSSSLSLDLSFDAWYLIIKSDGANGMTDGTRSNGLSIRPVREP